MLEKTETSHIKENTMILLYKDNMLD